MADLELSDFDAIIDWTPADEARPAVDLQEVPTELSDRGQRVLAGNARLRGIFDESANGYPSDSERAFALAYHAGACGLDKEDAAKLLADLYARPGKKPLHLSKLRLTLRAWLKGRERAEQETTAEPVAAEVTQEEEPPRKTKATTNEAVEPFEVLPAVEFLQTSFAGAARLVPSLGLTECGVGLLTGAGGDGKSVTTQNLECSWAGVDLPLAEALPAARRLRILGFQVENAPGMEQERLRKILGTARPPDGLFLFTRKEPIRFSGAKGRPNERALERLGVTLAMHAPIDLVIFDPLIYLHEAEENSSSEMMRWLVPLREVCRQAGAAILVVHHSGWSPDGEDARGRGSTAIRAWSDFELALRAQTKGGKVLHRLNLVKTNFAPRWKEPLTLELDPETLRFHVVNEAEVLCSTSALVEWMATELNSVWDQARLGFYAAVCAHFHCSDKTARDATASAIREKKLKDHGRGKALEVVASREETLL